MPSTPVTYQPQKALTIKNQSYIEKLAQGDEAAFKTLVNDYKDKVYNTCLGFLRNAHDAEDVSQEVFIQVYDSIDEFREEASISTWIYKIAVTKSLELIRYRKRQKRSGFFKALNNLFSENNEEIEDEDTEFSHPGIQLENKERAQVLMKEIEQLPKRQRVAFTLQKMEGLSYQEVADVMELSIPAVESLLHRARQNLKKQLYSYYQQNELD